MQHYARRPVEYLGNEYDRHQLLPELNAKNDEKLIRLGYLAEVPKDTVLKECGECGAKFISEDGRNGHAKERHKDRFLTPEEEDARDERKEKMLEEVAPLYLDKTKASRAGNTRARAAR